MPADDITLSPFFQAGGEDAAAVQSTLAALAASRDSVQGAAVLLRSGALTAQQRDQLLADMLELYERILGLILGMPT